MGLVSIQMKIKTGYYEHESVDKASAAKDIAFLKKYKKSYPHITSQVDEVIGYLNGVDVMLKVES